MTATSLSDGLTPITEMPAAIDFCPSSSSATFSLERRKGGRRIEEQKRERERET